MGTQSLKILCWLMPITLLAGCAANYTWGWHVVNPFLDAGLTNIQFLAMGYVYTISLTVVSMVFSLLIGIVLVIMDMLGNKAVRGIVQVYLAIFRAVPLLVLILWVYYGLPIILNISLEPFAAAVIALALADGAFEAEILRGGIQSVSKGQHDAADGLGLTFWQKFRLIVMPQAIRVILPTLVNQSVYMLKMSSLASFIGLADLTRKANELVVSAYRPLEIYSFLVLEYLVLIMIVTWYAKKLENKFSKAYTY